MKYELIHQIEKVRSLPIIYGKILYYIDHDSKSLVAISEENFHLQWKSEPNLFSVSIWGEFLLCFRLTIYSLSGKLVHTDSKPYSFTGLGFQNHTLWNLVDNEAETVDYHIYDFATKTLILENIKLEGMPLLYLGDSILVRNRTNGELIYRRIASKTPLWSFGITQLGTYEKRPALHLPIENVPREINKVYAFKDIIIVAISKAVLALSLDKGELILENRIY